MTKKELLKALENIPDDFEAEALCKHIKDLKELKKLAAKSKDPKTKK